MTNGPLGQGAEEIAVLWWLLLTLGVAVYALVLALLIVPMLRRRKGGATEDHTLRPAVPDRLANRWIVAGGVVLPGVILSVALASSVITMRGLPQPDADRGLVIEVVGHQWWWSMHYPAADVTVANEIHIPTGRPVELVLKSADVIHSFWVPELAGKLDALPDGPNTLVVQADEARTFRGQCAEFCGLQHAKMGVLVIAETPRRYAAWIARQQAPAVAVTAPRAVEGRAVFSDRGCGACHTVRGTAARGTEGPDLTHFAGRRTLAAATLSNTSEHLTRWIRDPDSVKEGTAMPTTRLRDDELAALVAYLGALE